MSAQSCPFCCRPRGNADIVYKEATFTSLPICADCAHKLAGGVMSGCMFCGKLTDLTGMTLIRVGRHEEGLYCVPCTERLEAIREPTEGEDYVKIRREALSRVQ